MIHRGEGPKDTVTLLELISLPLIISMVTAHLRLMFIFSLKKICFDVDLLKNIILS